MGPGGEGGGDRRAQGGEEAPPGGLMQAVVHRLPQHAPVPCLHGGHQEGRAPQVVDGVAQGDEAGEDAAPGLAGGDGLLREDQHRGQSRGHGHPPGDQARRAP